MDLLYYINRLPLYIGKLSESSLKHRSAILVLSVLIFFINPDVKVTFGSASLAGLGISVSPPMELSIGLLLLALLVYRLIAFWASVLLDSGTDSDRAKRKALLEFDPSWEAEESRPGDMEQLIRMESGKSVYKWTVRQVTWEFLVPNILALIALFLYAGRYISLYA